ncbi:MAG: hypothetical protein KDE27_05885, partial [Planctomycetes bacterium]|nr:hypothetical protein [Planctomycetota bacterium]
MATRRTSSSPAAEPTIALLLDHLERAFRGPSWHGTSLRGTLRGMTPARALWRARPDRNCIWDLVLHAAYWKYKVRHRLAGGGRGSFARSPANFPALPAPSDAAAWQRDLALLDAEHEQLLAAVRGLGTAGLPERRGS